jgi:hypothetical protein
MARNRHSVRGLQLVPALQQPLTDHSSPQSLAFVAGLNFRGYRPTHKGTEEEEEEEVVGDSAMKGTKTR